MIPFTSTKTKPKLLCNRIEHLNLRVSGKNWGVIKPEELIWQQYWAAKLGILIEYNGWTHVTSALLSLPVWDPTYCGYCKWNNSWTGFCLCLNISMTVHLCELSYPCCSKKQFLFDICSYRLNGIMEQNLVTFAGTWRKQKKEKRYCS